VERLSDRLLEYLNVAQGKIVNLKDLRVAFNIEPGSKDDQNLRVQMSTTMVKNKIVAPSGRNDGIYRVIKQIKPVPIFSVARKSRPPFDLIFPIDSDRGMEMDFADAVVIREGDVITLAGKKNKGKTIMCLNFAVANIEKRPVLMGNEYTKLIGENYEPDQRFINRLSIIGDGIEWVDEAGIDKITLLPAKGDYAEHIVPDRLNIIDWINLDANRLYDISKVMEDIKANLGRGVAIIALQKGEGDMGRGGQFTKDFTECEILLDGFGGGDDTLLTIGTVKEKTRPIIGRAYRFSNWNGAKIMDFREVVKCPTCFGKGWKKFGNTSIPCDACDKTGWVDK